MTKPEPARYGMTNWRSCHGALKQRGSLLIWLDKGMAWRGPRTGGNGRPAVFSGKEDSENSPGDCFPDERHSVLPHGESPVRASAPTNDRDGGEYSVDGWPRLASARLLNPASSPGNPPRFNGVQK